MDVVKTEHIKYEVTAMDNLSAIKVSRDIENQQQMTFRCNIPTNEENIESIKGEKNVKENITQCVEEMLIKAEIKEEIYTEECKLDHQQSKSTKLENCKIELDHEYIEHTVLGQFVPLSILKLDHVPHVNDMGAIKCKQNDEKEDTLDGIQADIGNQNSVQQYRQDCSKYETGDVAIHCKHKTNIEQLPASEAVDKSVLQNHIKVTRDGNIKYFKCQLCEYITNNRNSLKSHFSRKHSETDKLYQCVNCKYITKVKEHFVRHCKAQHNEKTKWYQCLSCDYKTKYKYNLGPHRLKHDDAAEILHCKLCDFRTKYKRALLQHHRCKHDDAAEVFHCELCDFKTKIKRNLSQHNRLKHDPSAKIFHCRVCDFKTKYKQTLLEHHRLKHDDIAENFHCAFCDFKTKYKRSLLLHHKLKHDDAAEIFHCDVCDFKTKNKGNLLQHHRPKHKINCVDLKQI